MTAVDVYLAMPPDGRLVTAADVARGMVACGWPDGYDADDEDAIDDGPVGDLLREAARVGLVTADGDGYRRRLWSREPGPHDVRLVRGRVTPPLVWPPPIAEPAAPAQPPRVWRWCPPRGQRTAAAVCERRGCRACDAAEEDDDR